MILQPGDWIGTVGDAGASFWLKPVYAGIRAYARGRYPATPQNPHPVIDVTHVRLVVDIGCLFEMTFPVGRYTTCKDSALAEKFAAGRVRVARWMREDISRNLLGLEASRWIGKPYDVGDLLDFRLTGLLGAWNWLIARGPFGFFGDRARRFGVCSTVAARILQRSGVMFPESVDSIDPNWSFNQVDTGAMWCPTDITKELSVEAFK